MDVGVAHPVRGAGAWFDDGGRRAFGDQALEGGAEIRDPEDDAEAAIYKQFADREALLAALAATGYREQRKRFAAAVGAARDPADQLAAFAAAYVRFAAEEPALFDVTFYAGLDKARHPELAEVGDALLATLLPVAALLAADEQAASDLLLRIASAAHGLAVFLRQGLFGVSGDALDETAQRAAHTARALVADLSSS